MQGINLKEHHALTSSASVKELVNPLLESIGITYFNYIKVHNKDCSRELLTNNPEWIDHFYQNALFNSVGAMDVEHLLPKGYFLWSEPNSKDPIYLQGRDFFNIDHGISFIVKRKDVTYLYVFASSRERYAINNFYVGNIDLLQNFIHYFNDEARPLIKEAENNRIYLPSKQAINHDRVNNIILSEEARQDFLNKTKAKRYFLLNESDHLFLTEKQANCARLYTKGYTSKHIASMMDVSPRTVEGCLLDIKNKLQDALGHAFSKAEIIKILRQSNIT